ncbi:MAG TPA: POTRA domain-containing protein [Blastocatellia bacterium]|nr:POTRA domain-containing protein [Blastocatellia bacterium]
MTRRKAEGGRQKAGLGRCQFVLSVCFEKQLIRSAYGATENTDNAESIDGSPLTGLLKQHLRRFFRLLTAYCLLPTAFCLLLCGFAKAQIGDFLGRRVTSVNVEVEGAPGSNVAEMRPLIDVVAGQDYSPVRIHDSLVRLHRSGLISGARVEAAPDGPNGVALRFIVRPQARIDSIAFEGETIFPASELRSRLNQLDPGERLSPGAITRGLGDLIAFYSARGYLKARVTPEIRLDPTGTRATVIYRIETGEQARVSKFEIDVKGAKIDLSKIRNPIAVGQPFTQSDVQEVMDRIRDEYLKQDYLAVRVTQNTTPDPNTNTVAVTITAETGPKIQVDVQGLDISDKEKRQTLPFYRQGGVDEFTLDEGARRLRDYAQRKGYFFAQVTPPKAPDLSQPTAQLVYQIEPGSRLKLSDIEIEGVDAIPHRTLEDEFKTKEASPFPVIGNRRGITSDELLRQDTNLLLKRLREVGYRRAHVDVRRGVSPSGGRLIITFDVQQGPRSYVEEVAIRGNNVLTTDELRAGLSIEPNEPLLGVKVTKDTEQVLSHYTRRGYAAADVFSELVELGSFDGQDRVRLIFNVSEGNRVRILNVSTRGTAHTSTARLENDFYLFKKGEWLRNDLLQETERDLYDTNAFNSVNISSEAVGPAVNGVEQRDVTVNLLEAKRRDLIFGFGYQANINSKTVPGLGALNGLRGLVQLTDSNMFGQLYTGSTQLRVAQNELFGQVSFQNPRPFGTRFPTLLSLFVRRLGERDFRTDRYTASIQAERRLSPDFIVYMTYSFERVSVFDLPCVVNDPNCQGITLEEIQRNAQPIRLGRIGPSFARDTRDNKFDPTTGTQTIGSFTFASTFLGGNEQFVKFNVEHNRYYPVRRFRDTIYTVSGRLGLATPFGGAQSLPISERFFAGGARDLRGFGFEEAGPTILVPDRDANGDLRFDSNNNVILKISPLGGNAVIVINNELRFPIWRQLGGTIFSDTGNVFRRVRDIKPKGLTQTFGFGFRIKTPVGPVRFDLGFLVLNKPAGIRGYQHHFTLGQTF